MSEIKHLAINYKTAEDFKKFGEYGTQELQMMEELEGNVIDADTDSPFYGIYVGENLAARMCLYRKEDDNNPIFDPPHDYLVIWKLEVLEKYRGRGFGSELIDYVNEHNMPIKAVSRQYARSLFAHHDVETLKDDIERGLGAKRLMW